MKLHIHPILTCTILLAVGAAPSALFARKDSGTGVYTRVSSNIIERADGSQVIHFADKGIIMASDTKSPLHLCTQDASGTAVLAADGSLVMASGYADGINADGDVFWIWWRNSPTERKWGYLGGTGKFAGIKGGGTTVQLSVHPDGRSSISWEGEWTIGK